MQDELSTSLGAPLEISKGANNGKITITFFSEEELENILLEIGQGSGIGQEETGTGEPISKWRRGFLRQFIADLLYPLYAVQFFDKPLDLFLIGGLDLYLIDMKSFARCRFGMETCDRDVHL